MREEKNFKFKLNISEVLLLIFLISFYILHILNISNMLANGIIAFNGIVCFIYSILNKKNENYWIVIATFGAILMITSTLINNNSSYYEVLWIFCYLGVALVLSNFNIRSNVLMFAFILISSLFIIQALKGIDPQNALNSGSGNNISTFILFYLFLLYIKRNEENKTMILWPAFLAFVISIWGNGRGGLISCIIFIVLIYVYNFIHVKKGKISSLIKIAVLIAVALLFVSHFFHNYIMTFIEKTNRYGNTSIRTLIWKEYIGGVFKNIVNFTFGFSTKNNEYKWLSYYSGNIHNAFFIAHSKFGIIGFLFIFIELIKSNYRFFKAKDYVLNIIFITWFCRSMFDWTGFLGIFDVIFWYFLIKSRKIYLHNKTNNDESVERLKGL